MKSKIIKLSVLSLLIILYGFVSQVFAQKCIRYEERTLECRPNPLYPAHSTTPQICAKGLVCVEYENEETPQTPIPSRRSGTSGLKLEQQMQLMMMQSILQPLFNSLFDFSDLFAPPGPSRQEIERQRQEEIRRQQEIKAKQEALNRWLQIQAETERERAQEEARKREEGQRILARSSISGSSGGLTPFSWSSPQTSLTPISLKGYETRNFSPVEQLICSAYFSRLAEGAMQSGDLEGARFYASQMDNVIQGLPTSIECKPPKEIVSSINTQNTEELNRKLTQMAKMAELYNEITPKIEELTHKQIELDKVVKKKEESKKKIEEVEKQIEELKAKAQTEDKPEKKAEVDDLLAKALALKAEAEKEYQEALTQEQKLTQEKENIEKSIEQIKLKYQEGGGK